MLILRRFVPAASVALTVILLVSSCAGAPRQGDTAALLEAGESGDITAIEELVSESVNVAEIDDDGKTALHHAVIAGDILVSGALLNAGADPDVADDDGRTALHYAVLGCHEDLIAMLLGAGADPELADRDGDTALDLGASAECDSAGDIIFSSLESFVPADS